MKKIVLKHPSGIVPIGALPVVLLGIAHIPLLLGFVEKVVRVF